MYLFTSQRLGFRPWIPEDVEKMHRLNINEKVMRYFPKTLSKTETKAFVDRMDLLYKQHGYCYFAVDLLETTSFIGFIGLDIKTFKADFTPIQDIGWRLAPEYWGRGHATEGAKRCMKFAREDLGWKEIYAIAPEVNTPSIAVMKKLGMEKVKAFIHPQLEEASPLQPCVLYKATL
ncbi:N-acetyltransferase [Robertkochia marina]|uniref:N-acetyltransferase n=1 Tax=Robertkochia marina TaxID=1227945 RepID=A0A4S3M4G3_9FLAO|nr:GNAT family N-acetyltransferase [Robertkochia marina]THD69201.1 N-acetyltransferase [Robertkochia marina]TRZ47540.1 N-acetyltransferase [Robertkochia marina]